MPRCGPPNLRPLEFLADLRAELNARYIAQAHRLKGKWEARKRRRAPKDAIPVSLPADDTPSVRIIRARRYAVKPLSIDDAAIEVGSAPDAFVVFRNTTNDAITVLFRRRDGHLGLIEPEG